MRNSCTKALIILTILTSTTFCVSKGIFLAPHPGDTAKVTGGVGLTHQAGALKDIPKEAVTVSVSVSPTNKRFGQAQVIAELNKVLALSGRKARAARSGEVPYLDLEIQTKSLSNNYQVFGSGPETTLFTGATLTVSVKVKGGPAAIVSSTLEPPYSVSGPGFKKPEDAPFADALYGDGGFMHFLVAGLAHADGLAVAENALKSSDERLHLGAMRFIVHTRPAGGAAVLARSVGFDHTKGTCNYAVWALHAMGAKDQMHHLVRAALPKLYCAEEVIRLAGMWDDKGAILAASLFFTNEKTAKYAGYRYAFAAEGIVDRRVVPAFMAYLKTQAENKRTLGTDKVAQERAMEILADSAGVSPGDSVQQWLEWWKTNEAKYPFGQLEEMLKTPGS